MRLRGYFVYVSIPTADIGKGYFQSYVGFDDAGDLLQATRRRNGRADK